MLVRADIVNIHAQVLLDKNPHIKSVVNKV
jgi:hypothetical protein